MTSEWRCPLCGKETQPFLHSCRMKPEGLTREETDRGYLAPDPVTAPAGSEDAGLVLSAEERRDIRALVRDVIAEFSMDDTGHVIDCGFDSLSLADQFAGGCGCASLPKRLGDLPAACIARTPPPAGDAQGSQDARNGPLSHEDAGDGRGHGRDDESGRGGSRG